MYIRYIILLIICLQSNGLLHAQVVISGRVVDSLGRPIGNASVTYKEIGSPAVKGYTMTKPDGSFRLTSNTTNADSIELAVSHLTYRTWRAIIANNAADHAIKLEASYTELAEVDVAPFPIYKRRDTISYVVDAFTSRQDRVIGDIIQKLPGIEVVNGRIYYQGKPIQKYMVNNLDLMEGRYGMINNNLPADAVKNVQIVENDQPIKVLDSVVASDRASLNLELKNPVTTTGTGRVGAGALPALWDVNFTPMVFGKTFQLLASGQTNNTGNDAAKTLQPFYTGGQLFHAATGNTPGPSYLSVRDVTSPGFDEAKWLDNRLFLISANALQKLSSGLEVKGNIAFYNDRRQRRGYTATNVFAPDQQILLTEAVDNRYRLNDLTVGLLLEKNEKQVYLRNKLNYHSRWNRDRGALRLNTANDISQNRTYDDFSLLNNLSLARFIGKQLITIQSDVEIMQTPQHLVVQPGQLLEALNNGEPYERMRQRIDYRSLRTENELSFVRRIGWLSVTPSLMVNYRSSTLKTGITTTVDGEANDLGAGYWNDMVASRGQLAMGFRLNYERGNWKLSGNLPYSLHLFDVEQQGERPLRNVTRNTFNPEASVRYALSSRQELGITSSYGRQFEEMNNFYNAYIASTYRSLLRYSARLLSNQGVNTAVSYNFNHTLKGIFANASYNYANRIQDYLFQTSIDSLAQSVISIANRSGRNTMHRLSAGYGHFFAHSKTVVKLQANAGLGQADYLLNGVMAKRKSRSWDGSFEVVNSKWHFLGFSYKLVHGYGKTLLAMGESNTVVYQNHFLQASTHIGDRHSFAVQNAYYLNNIEGIRPQYFVDCSYTYHLKKWKTDIVLNAQNLLDNSRYTQQFSSDYQLVETYFELRPRQFVVSTRFRF